MHRQRPRSTEGAPNEQSRIVRCEPVSVITRIGSRGLAIEGAVDDAGIGVVSLFSYVPNWTREFRGDEDLGSAWRASTVCLQFTVLGGDESVAAAQQ